MIIKRLSLTNYKNIKAATLQFSDKLNCIVGGNGMGKTNLLDSIYILSFTRSYQYLPDSLIIHHDEEMAIVSGEYQWEDGQKESLVLGLSRGKSKKLRRNKKEYSQMSDHIGLFPAVMIAPGDMDLIRGGSAERRSFMDQILCQESRVYLTAAKGYKNLLEQRNSLLKQQMGLDLSLIEVLNQQMAPLAEKITAFRNEWIRRISPLFHNYYSTITKDKECVKLTYATSTGVQEPKAEDFLTAWQSNLQEDLACGYTRVGPHRDDLIMLIDDFLIRKIGSQGQNKSYMVALKLAQYSLLCQLHPDNLPILLLDDIFDKLDEDRVEKIVELVSDTRFGQIFLSDTNRKYLDQILENLPIEAYTIFQAEDGNFIDITPER